MRSRTRTLSLVAAIATSILAIADNAHGQCSGGRRGGSSPGQSNLATGSFNPLVSPLVSLASSSHSYPSQLQFAQQQQMLAIRQQVLLQQQRQSQQLAQSRYDSQEAIQATRLARAEAKRAKRADRIAALKAKRNADRMSEERDVILASAATASTLISASESNPFQ